MIDKIAGNIVAKFGLTFKTSTGQIIGSRQEINPWTGSTEYVFDGFGRNITLTIDGGTPVTFHTMTGTGTVNATVPKKTLGFTLNGESIGTARVAMENDATIEIPLNHLVAKVGSTSVGSI